MGWGGEGGPLVPGALPLDLPLNGFVFLVEMLDVLKVVMHAKSLWHKTFVLLATLQASF